MSAERANTFEQIWREDRHLSDLALTAAADGELGLLPDEARQHLDGCPACQERLGGAVLLATATDEAMRVAGPAAQPEPAPVMEAALAPPPSSGRGRRPLPRAALVVALTLAALGAAPALGEAVLGLPRWASWAMDGLPVLLRAGLMVARRVLCNGEPALVVAPWAAALVLIVVGTAMARIWSQRTGEVA